MKNSIYPETTVMPTQPLGFLLSSPGNKVGNIPQPSGDNDEV